MNNTDTPTKPKSESTKTLLKVFITFTCIGLAVAAMFAFTPKGFNLNLSQIGTGKPALVFVYDSNLTASLEQATSLNKVRNSLEGDILFLVAKVGRPDARAFTEKYNLRPVDFALFDENGKLLRIKPGLLTEREIKVMIEPLLN